MASMTLIWSEKFGLPACQSLKSRIMTEPFLTVGWDGGLTALRRSNKSSKILPLALSPCLPSCEAILDSVWVPSHTSVLPFSFVISTRGTLTTRANGLMGWLKSASECTGCDWGGDSLVGGSAVLPETNDNRGLGPRTELVTWVASAFMMMLGSKNSFVIGGSCWMFLYILYQYLSLCQGVINIPSIIIERACVPSWLQYVSVFYHLFIQKIQFVVIDDILQYYKSISMKSSGSKLKVFPAEPL